MMYYTPINFVWLRRDLRVHDHAAFYAAMHNHTPFVPCFIFDTAILQHFKNPRDRRLSFIVRALKDIHSHCKKHGAGLLVMHGSVQEIWQCMAHVLPLGSVFADEDYEPATRQRDADVATILQPNASLQLMKDHVIFAPHESTGRTGQPFKVFTPYRTTWRAQLTDAQIAEFPLQQWHMLHDISGIQQQLKTDGVQVLDMDASEAEILHAIGYQYQSDALWKPDNAQKILRDFLENHIGNYTETRDFMGMHGTSRISPYLRFGLLSVRECVRAAMAANNEHAEKWLSELVWREFYAMILYITPESADSEWTEKYRGKLHWQHNETWFTAWKSGQTGYPIIDAAMRELVSTGWMHNRARMIVASFLTKDLLLDWRMGEAFFSEHLMDYELPSNVGGWQWAASTGTDAQPYFRIFNPALQSKRFDPLGAYIRHWVPELKHLNNADIHQPHLTAHGTNYPQPIVDHSRARLKAHAMFKNLSG